MIQARRGAKRSEKRNNPTVPANMTGKDKPINPANLKSAGLTQALRAESHKPSTESTEAPAATEETARAKTLRSGRVKN